MCTRTRDSINIDDRAYILLYLRKTRTQRVKWQLSQVFVRSLTVSSFVSSKEEILLCHRRGMRGSPVQFRFSENTALPTMKFELPCLQNRIAERSEFLKGHSQLMQMRIRCHFLADLHVRRGA